MKRCPDCGETKPVDGFTLNRATSDGRCVYCRECYAARSRQYYQQKQTRLGKTLRVRPDVPAGHKYCPRCKAVRPHSDWHKTRRTRDGYSSQCKYCRVKGSRRTYLKRAYGLTPEEVTAMIRRQGGRCAICRTRPAEHVDHDHVTGEVRGVTCFPCNGGMGQFKENVQWLANAIAYLENGGARQPADLTRRVRFNNEPKSAAEEWLRRLLASEDVSTGAGALSV